jgi:hypothetical protein
MKNQYFADINDYRKYGLLRILADGGKLKTTVCWMLTPNDERTDGRFTSYLDASETWSHYDPELFGILQSCITQQNKRTVHSAEAKQIIPAATYFPKILPDNPDQRRQYFAEFRVCAAEHDLVFFDPDNGIEVRSVPYGSRHSCKYIYWSELADTFAQGQSLLIYQHYVRVKRDIFVQQLVGGIFEKMPTALVFTFSTAHVLFLLVSQNKHEEYLTEKFAVIAAKWGSQIRAEKYQRA